MMALVWSFNFSWNHILTKMQTYLIVKISYLFLTVHVQTQFCLINSE